MLVAIMLSLGSAVSQVGVYVVLDLDVGPRFEQPLDDLTVAVIRSRLQRGAVLSSPRIDVGPLLE